MDVIYYYTLSPAFQNMLPFAAAMFGASFVLWLARASFKGVFQQREGIDFAFKNAIFTFLIFIAFYVPLPNPNLLVGVPGLDLDLTQGGNSPFSTVLPATETTVAIFLTERISSGLDQLTLQTLAGDVGVAAIQNRGEVGRSDVIMEWMAMRGKFLLRYARNMWESNLDFNRDGSSDTALGNFGEFAQVLLTGNMAEYVFQQWTNIMYSLGSFVFVISLYLVLLLSGWLILMLSGIFKFGPVYVFLIAGFLLPIGYTFQGMQFVERVVKTIGAWLLIKPVLAMVIWLSFLLIESIVLEGLQEQITAASTPVDVDRLSPGFLFTGGGGTAALDLFEMVPSTVSNFGSVGVSLVLVLLTMVTVLWQVPKIIKTLFSRV